MTSAFRAFLVTSALVYLAIGISSVASSDGHSSRYSPPRLEANRRSAVQRLKAAEDRTAAAIRRLEKRSRDQGENVEVHQRLARKIRRMNAERLRREAEIAGGVPRTIGSPPSGHKLDSAQPR